MNAYILRIKGKYHLENPVKRQESETFYEVEVLGHEMPKEELPERDTSRKAEEGR